MMSQIVAPWLFWVIKTPLRPENGGNPRGMAFDKANIMKSSQRRPRDRPFAKSARAAVRDRQQSGAGFSISELDRVLAMLWS